MRASYSAADMADMATDDGDRRVGVWGTGRESVGPEKDKLQEFWGNGTGTVDEGAKRHASGRCDVTTLTAKNVFIDARIEKRRDRTRWRPRTRREDARRRRNRPRALIKSRRTRRDETVWIRTAPCTRPVRLDGRGLFYEGSICTIATVAVRV